MVVFESEYGVDCDGDVLGVDRAGVVVLEPLPDGDVVLEGAEYVGAVYVGGE